MSITANVKAGSAIHSSQEIHANWHEKISGSLYFYWATEIVQHEFDWRHQVEFLTIGQTNIKVSRIALGTWAIGGWMWGGSDDLQKVL
jgi:hypothetical protein